MKLSLKNQNNRVAFADVAFAFADNKANRSRLIACGKAQQPSGVRENLT